MNCISKTIFTFLIGTLLFVSHSKASIKIDGSSTVFPITEAIAEEYGKLAPRVRVQVGVSGTGGGFKKFSKAEIDINNASREIKDAEANEAKENKVEYLKIAVAYDGITVVVNPKNTFAKNITVAELKKIWEPNSKVQLWSDVRETWPKEKMLLFGPGTDSGTFDYFTEAINGKSHVSRAEFTKSEDDNVLVKGVSGNLYALGYFGFAYYEENKSKLTALSVDGVMPSFKSINDSSYKPLSREVYIYVTKAALKREEVYKFIEFYIDNVGNIAKEVGYVPLPEKLYQEQKKNLIEFMK